MAPLHQLPKTVMPFEIRSLFSLFSFARFYNLPLPTTVVYDCLHEPWSFALGVASLWPCLYFPLPYCPALFGKEAQSNYAFSSDLILIMDWFAGAFVSIFDATKYLYYRVSNRPSVVRSVGPLRLLIFSGFGVLWSTAWPVMALVSVV